MRGTLLTLLIIGSGVIISSCRKDHAGITPALYDTPSTYSFQDENGNNTVNFTGQKIRLEMLSEMTAYMKTANAQGVSLSAQQLKDMFANNGITWSDAPSYGMNNSSKQLRNKAAGGDPTIQAMFEGYMDSLANASQSMVAGGPGQAGVVVSNSGTKQYLFDAKGVEYTQIIEKGLMGAVFYYQIALHYLSDDQLDVDNSTAVDPANGKHYTQMEHHWDEAYGYFTSEVDYPNNGIDRFWGKYAWGRENLLGTGTKIRDAFLQGRVAITMHDLTVRDQQRDIIRAEMERVCAGTAIHYLNEAMANMADDALRNHTLSEAIAFITSLQYGHTPTVSQQEIANLLTTIGDDFYNVTLADLTQARDDLANLMGMNDVKTQL